MGMLGLCGSRDYLDHPGVALGPPGLGLGMVEDYVYATKHQTGVGYIQPPLI